MSMLNQLTIAELDARLVKQEVSERGATQSRADQTARAGGKIHTFICRDQQDAMAQADALPNTPARVPGRLFIGPKIVEKPCRA